MAVNFPVYQPPSNPAESFARGEAQGAEQATRPLTLANMLNNEKLSALKTSEAEKDIADEADIQQIVKGGKYDTPQGYWDTASQLTSAGHPEAAQSFLKLGTDVTSGKYQQNMQKFDLASKQYDVIAAGFDNVRAQLDAIKGANPKVSDDTLNATAKTLAVGEARQLMKDHPELTPAVQRFLSNPANLTYAGIIQLEEQTNAGQKLLAQHRANIELGLKQQTTTAQVTKDTADTAEAQARTKAIQSGGGGRYSISEPQTQAGQDLKDQFIGATGGRVTYAQLRALNFDELAKQGMTAKALVQSGLTYAGQTRAAGAVGQRSGSISILENSINGASDQVLDAMSKLNQSDVQAVNKALAAGRTAFGNPNQARYATAVQGLLNEYSRVIAGGGQATDASRAEAHKVLNTNQSPAQIRAVIAQIKRETAIVKGAASSAMSTTGNTAPAAPPAAGSTVDWSQLQ